MTNGNGIDRHAGRAVFGRNAATYDEARSGYPNALFERIGEVCAFQPATLEIGAGTGLATAGLLQLAPRRLVALEPDAGMAAVLADKLVRTHAEIANEPFPDSSISGTFDLVTCAAAFHWLDAQAALARIDDLLAPDGILAVWWNSYFGHGQPDPFGERVSELIGASKAKLPPSYVDGKHYAFDTPHHLNAFAQGGFETLAHTVFVSERTYTAAQARDLYATFSFVELLADADREALLAAIENLVETEFGGHAPGLCATSLYICQRADGQD